MKDGPKLFGLHQGHLDSWAKCFIKKKMMGPKLFFAKTKNASQIKLYRVSFSGVNFIGVSFIGVTKKSRRGDAIFGIPSGWRGLIAVQFGVVINEESCMGWKPHNLEGCRGLNNLFTRLGVTTEFWPGVSG